MSKFSIFLEIFLEESGESISFITRSIEAELIEFYQGFFRNLLECCDPLVRCNSNILEVLQEYISNTSPDSLQIMMPQPYTSSYITPKVIRKYIHNSAIPYKEMYNLVEHHFSILRQISDTYQPSAAGLSRYLCSSENRTAFLHHKCLCLQRLLLQYSHCLKIHLQHFYDFMQSPEGTNLVYSKDDTLQLLAQHIAEMEV